MKKKILTGVILSCFLLLITPTINAIQYNEVREVVEQQIQLKINSFEFEKLVGPILNLLLIIYKTYSLYLFFRLCVTYYLSRYGLRPGFILLALIEAIIMPFILILGIFLEFIYAILSIFNVNPNINWNY